MPNLTLVFANRNYSSWSMRPWLAMKAAGIAFDEVLIPLDLSDTKARIAEYSPAGKMPVLLDGDCVVWESLAILEHLAERFPEARLWPADRVARAHARAITAEMHAGFMDLRRECPMNLWRPPEPRALSEGALRDVARIDAMWSEARARFGEGGPFLFGAFTAADAMYAPVAARLRTYSVPVSPHSAAYVEAIHALPAFQDWRRAALAEPWEVAQDEVDWPVVKRHKA